MNALIIVDLQNDFCEPEGSLAVKGSLEIIETINKLKKSDKFDLVVCTLDFHPIDHCSFVDNNPGQKLFEEITRDNGIKQVMWPKHCVEYSWGSNFHPDLERNVNDVVILKGRDHDVECYSGFGNEEYNDPTSLKQVLDAMGIEEVFICGLATDYCVGSTALDAARLGYKTVIIADACKGVAEETTEQMVLKLDAADIAFTDSEHILSA